MALSMDGRVKFRVLGPLTVTAEDGREVPIGGNKLRIVLAGLLVAGALGKPLNALLLGQGYATSMGVEVRRTRLVVMVAAGLLAGGVTAFCGPVAFIGIAIPHLARLLVGTSDHRLLLPATALVGAITALLCAIASHPPGTETVIPLNVMTSLVGAPVVIAVLLRARRSEVVT